jgi:hypothetical protein
MAGYMKKLNGYVYDGEHVANQAMVNGIFVEIDSSTGKVKPITAAGDTEFRVDEKTTLWGKYALVLNVILEGDKEQYFLENDFDLKAVPTYDSADYECKAGEYCRMHRPVINDQLIMTVTSELYAALNVGDTVKPAVGGSVAKKT